MKSWFVFISVVLASCNGCREQKQLEVPSEQIQNDLIQASRTQLKEEMTRIAEFIKLKKWPMQQTNTGLYYWIYENGTGARSKNGENAVISYTVTLLDGTECYQSTDEQPVSFLIGQDNIETGLHEGILYMHEGDKAKFVLPSHLAFGFTGDSGKIPQNASLVYDIHLLALK